MNKHIARTLCALTALGLGSIARADFINGGFETGDFTGWLVEHGLTYTGFTSSGVNTTFAGHQAVIGPVADPNSSFDTPFNGNFMARLNIAEVNYDMSRISQTATILPGDSSELFINWGAVMQDPGHSVSDQPFFTIAVEVNGPGGGNDYFFSHTAGAGGNVGWTNTVGNVWTKSDTAHITGLVAGDSVKVVLTVADCDLGGHFGYAYLDGIGGVFQPPGSVPDGGATALMLLTALLGLAAFRRKN